MVAPCNEWHGVMCRCVECLQCEGLFSPQKFVCHSHSPENRTCHWGFDSSNWLTYLQVNTSRVDSLHLTLTFWIQLSEDYTKEERERHSKVMEDFKNRYCSPALRTPQQAAPGPREGKRRQVRRSHNSQELCSKSEKCLRLHPYLTGGNPKIVDFEGSGNLGYSRTALGINITSVGLAYKMTLD